ncbi:MAG: hypothetical protein IPK32_13385 [Verrucomicrobiaceae bacterium]|nr:hypothetical protein [Verrucomicrobiaceae bacterium]
MQNSLYFRFVGILSEPPRKLETLTMTLHEGLQPIKGLAILMLAAAVVLIIAAAFRSRFRVWLALAGLILFLCDGLLYQQIQDTVRRRSACYLNGRGVTGQVVRQEKVFGGHRLVLNVDDAEILVTHPSPQLWQNYPVGSKLLGLSHEGEFFFGQEAGVHFVHFRPKKEAMPTMKSTSG